MNRYYFTEKNVFASGRASENPMPRFLTGAGHIGDLSGYPMTGGRMGGEKGHISFSDEDLACGVLFLGSAGCGKTNVINKLLSDVLHSMTADDLAIVYDVKHEFTAHFYADGDYVLSPSSYGDVWNIYHDILAFAIDENGSVSMEQVRMRALEAASRLFEGQQSSTQPFFYNAAVQVTAGILELNIMDALVDGETGWLNNRSLREELSGMDRVAYYDRFQKAGGRFLSLAHYFEGTGDAEGKGIVTEISSMVNRQFVGAFGEDGDFSLVQLVKERGGRAVFVQNDISLGDTLSAILTTIVDMTIGAAARPDPHPRGRIFLFLDELATIRPTKLELALTLLRQSRLCIIGGLQDVERLHMNVPDNKSRTQTMLNAFQSVVAMNTTSAETREYLQKRFGKTMLRRQFDAADGRLETQLVEGNVVEDYEFAALDVGDAFCALRGKPPFRFHFDRFIIR